MAQNPQPGSKGQGRGTPERRARNPAPQGPSPDGVIFRVPLSLGGPRMPPPTQQIREIRRCERSSFCPSPKVGASETLSTGAKPKAAGLTPQVHHHTGRSGDGRSHAVSELAATNREPSRTACRILDGKLSQRAGPHNEPGEAASHTQGPDDDEWPRMQSMTSWALQHSITSSPVRDVFQSRTFEASRGSELDDFS